VRDPASNFAGDLEVNMIDNSKQNCIDSLSGSLTRTANWRRTLQSKYPNDPRTGRAADRLCQLASETDNLTDKAWSELAPYYSWASEKWSEAVSQASRYVGFRGVNTLPAFVDALVGILSEQR
jgi:hypothetical protein